jgi:hypothetical protein
MDMVHVRDEGSRVDGSIESVWRYLNDPELHGKAHKNSRNVTQKIEGGTTILVTAERNFRGSWVKVGQRLTVLPPLGHVIEFVAGPFAGSKMFTVYTPLDADHTQVDVYGEFRSPTLADAEVETAARQYLDEVFSEDAPAIKTLHSSP